jgi:hypothetical protein
MLYVSVFEDPALIEPETIALGCVGDGINPVLINGIKSREDTIKINVISIVSIL